MAANRFAYKSSFSRLRRLLGSPADHPTAAIHSNSKWARGLGRRLGWIEADPQVVDGLERVQQCSILCPDTLSQMTMARYLKKAIADGSLKKYVAQANALYKHAAHVTLKAVDTYLQRPRLTPAGGLYTVVDIGTNAEELVRARGRQRRAGGAGRRLRRLASTACASRSGRFPRQRRRSTRVSRARSVMRS